jgi:hypothetical protein
MQISTVQTPSVSLLGMREKRNQRLEMQPLVLHPCNRHLRKNTPTPPIGIDDCLFNKDVPAEARHGNCPNKIIDSAKRKDSQCNNAVQVIRELFVDALAGGRRDIWRHHEVDV